ncbi:MAG: GyrI-like domain-containing protein [Methanobacteriaceae archaeon]|nr:GyrI-like domain-containing protein [Methanobacteriaceae archaeon]
MKIEEKIIPDQKIAVMKHKGPLSDLEVLISKLSGWVEDKEIPTDGDYFIIFYRMPDKVEADEIVYDLGVPIADVEVDKTPEIDIADMIEHKVLSGIHEGAHENIRDSYTEIIEFSEENHYDIIGSPKEVLLNGPIGVDPENHLVEIQIPVIKM